jgi:hypothetical protein
LLDRTETGIDIDGVFDDFPGNTWHVPVGSEEVKELAFLFGVQTSPNLHGLGSICNALASLAALKMLDVEGMAGLSGVEDTHGLSSLNLAVMTTMMASLMLSC